MALRLKIVSNGLPGRGTRVVNAETGEEIFGVRALSWKMDSDNPATAVFELVGVEIDALTGPAKTMAPQTEIN